jgi:hypothetical protein
MQQLHRLLAPGGLIYIGVPPVFPLNRLSTFMIRKLHAPLPANAVTNRFHDPDEHINVFTRRSMYRLARDCGLQVRPLPLTWGTLTIRRAAKLLLTAGASSGAFLLSR